MPQLPVEKMRTLTRETIAALEGDIKILVFGCEHGLNVDCLERADTKGVRLICSGMLPPTLVEYALKHGADGVMVSGCRHNDCYFRFGNHWIKQRFEGERKPILRGRADRDRIRLHGAAETDRKEIEKDLDDFRARLIELNQAAEININEAS
jgi:coenzyme F420-reducing hydrogenase delta subunit